MTERTPLRASTPPQYDPQYVFNTGRLNRYKVRQFQCCVCATLLACFVMALVITVAYSVDKDVEDKGNGTTPGNSSANEALVSLISLQFPLPERDNSSWLNQMPSATQLEGALEIGKVSLDERDELEENGPHLPENSPSYRHQMAVRTSPEATRLARAGYILNLAMKHLVTSGIGRPKGSQAPMGPGPSIEADWMPQEVCGDEAATPCSPTPYRSADGSCNNIRHPLKWGVAMRPFRRTLPPNYSDGVMEPRKAFDGGSLPSAREISIKVHRPIYRDDPNFTVMLAVWGQFIDHDITATALNTGANGSAISCCGAGRFHPECFPVHLSDDDPYFHTFNVSCMEFVRSAPAPTCRLGPREQLNQASAYLDGSVIYGPNLNVTKQLRSMQGGRLRMSITSDGRALLPYSSDPFDGCNQEQENARGRYCFASGDARANENLHLTTMHLLWARQHNLVADKLTELNPSWQDERVFQEARRITVAQLQHITYSEFLPILLGKELMDNLELTPETYSYFHGYNESVDPTIANSFAASAFRFAHTLLPGLMKLLGNGSEEYVELHRMLFNPYSLYSPGHLDSTLRGALETHIEKVDPYFTKELTEHLFEQTIPSKEPIGTPCGLDLVSLNIQRGRDHGLPAYPAWRERCGLTRPTNFSDMTEYIDSDSLQRMTELYRSVEDIDLYTGGLAERPLKGGFIGPTITCLLVDQFIRIKRGDRFWYETAEKPQAFTPGQLTELRKTSLARIICDNADSVQEVQPQVMRSVGRHNKRVSCGSIPTPNLSLWQVHKSRISHLKLGLLATGVRTLALPTRLGAKVIEGHIVTDSGTPLWDGQLPLGLRANVGLRPFWTGSLKKNSLNGNFSLHTLHNKWLNGRFSFQLSIVWNLTGSLDVSGSYSSPIYFKELEQFPHPEFSLIASDFTGELSSTPIIPAGTDLPTAPVILEGAYSEDRNVFWWSGGVILTIPGSYPKQMWTTIPTDHSMIGNGTQFQGKVISAAMTTDGDHALSWNGSLPVAFKLKAPPKGVSITWNGSFENSDTQNTIVQGIVSFRNTNAGLEDGFFSVTAEILPPLKHSVSGIFKSIIYLKHMEEFEYLEQVSSTAISIDWDSTHSSDTQLHNYVEIPVVLIGHFSLKKSEFLWSGNISFLIPNSV